MNTDRHEKHFTASDTVRDLIIGLSDGLTVPFALAAGLSGAIANTHLILTAGFAEIAAGSIAMGLGGYLSARSEAEQYAIERRREEDEIVRLPEREEEEVREVLRAYGVPDESSEPVVQALRRQPEQWVNFMMRFELGLEEPDPQRARTSARNIALAYITGGVIPLAPYFFTPEPKLALGWSVVLTLGALGGFGYLKGALTGAPSPWRTAGQMVIVGGLAAAAAFLIARAIS